MLLTGPGGKALDATYPVLDRINTDLINVPTRLQFKAFWEALRRYQRYLGVDAGRGGRDKT